MPLQAEIYLWQMSQQTLLVYCFQFKWSTVDPLMNGILTEEFQKQWTKCFGSEIFVHNGNVIDTHIKVLI